MMLLGRTTRAVVVATGVLIAVALSAAGVGAMLDVAPGNTDYDGRFVFVRSATR